MCRPYVEWLSDHILFLKIAVPELLHILKAIVFGYSKHTSPTYNFPLYFYSADMLKSYAQLEIHVVPMSLKLLSSHDTKGACYAACFHQDGKLLIGCHDGICIFSDDYHEADHMLKLSHVASIASLGEYDSYAFIHFKRIAARLG